MLRIGTSLAQAGFDVWLVGRRLKNSQLFENQYVKSHRFALVFNKGKLFYLEYNLRLFFWLLFQRVDIIGGIDLDSILPCYFSAKIKNILRGPLSFGFWVLGFESTQKTKIKVVYDAHELFSETPEVVRRPKIRRFWLAVERFIVPKVDAAYTVSQSIVEEFEQRYGRRFDLIRNLPMRHVVSSKKIIFNKELGQNINFEAHYKFKIILYQGALNEGRGLETAIEAMQFVENAELWLVGEGDLSQILRGMVALLNLQKKVKFLGFIVPDELPFYTAKADIGLLILEDKGLSYRYSLANKFLDYIQAEVPQICIQFPEYQRLNEQYNVAVLIEKTDVPTYLIALNRLLGDVVFYQQIKENCRAAATVLCWEKEEEQLVELYRNL